MMVPTRREVPRDPRVIMLFKYENKALNNQFREAFLWFDTLSSQVKYQSVSDITCWHGHMKVNNRSMEIKFDCLAGCRSGDENYIDQLPSDRVRLKTTRVVATAQHGVFQGIDRRGRKVEITMLATYSSRDGDAAQLDSSWDLSLSDWVNVSADAAASSSS